MVVTEATRGHITIRVGEKSVTVYGEMLAWPDYQLYADSLKTWDSPHDSEALTEQEKAAILNEVCEYLRQIGRVPIVLS